MSGRSRASREPRERVELPGRRAEEALRQRRDAPVQDRGMGQAAPRRHPACARLADPRRDRGGGLRRANPPDGVRLSRENGGGAWTKERSATPGGDDHPAPLRRDRHAHRQHEGRPDAHVSSRCLPRARHSEWRRRRGVSTHRPARRASRGVRAAPRRPDPWHRRAPRPGEESRRHHPGAGAATGARN